jgi:hypothetical protein
MNQYCRYCANALDYNGEGEEFLCEADAPCGNNGAGHFYPTAKAKRANHCKYFSFNEIDIFSLSRGSDMIRYQPREVPMGTRTYQREEEDQIRIEIKVKDDADNR